MQDAQDIPLSFLCPITHELMKNPVIDREGNSYEEEAIALWLRRNTTSPVTRNDLHASHLTPNRALKDAIEEFLRVAATAAAAAATAATSSASESASASPATALSLSAWAQVKQ